MFFTVFSDGGWHGFDIWRNKFCHCQTGIAGMCGSKSFPFWFHNVIATSAICCLIACLKQYIVINVRDNKATASFYVWVWQDLDVLRLLGGSILSRNIFSDDRKWLLFPSLRCGLEIMQVLLHVSDSYLIFTNNYKCDSFCESMWFRKRFCDIESAHGFVKRSSWCKSDHR